MSHGTGKPPRPTSPSPLRPLILEIVDDGLGRGDTERRSGLENLRHRVERHRGAAGLESCTIEPITSHPRRNMSAMHDSTELSAGLARTRSGCFC